MRFAMSTNDMKREHESLQGTIYALSIVFAVLSTTSVLLRIYTRGYIIGVYGPDDVTIGIAQVGAIAVSIITILEGVYGLGRHTELVNASDTMKQLRCLFANILIYNASQIVTKCSFLLQFRRVFPATQRLCFWLLIGITIWGFIQEIVAAFACTPLSVIQPNMVGKCIESLRVWYLTSSMNIVTDFIIFLVPLPSVLKLQMRTRKKVMLFCLFCLGFFVCAISLIRISTLRKGIHTTDPNWDNAPSAYWSVVELNCGILCACLPTLRPFISKIMPAFLSVRTGSGNETALSRRESVLQHRKNPDAAVGIYIQKEVEMHSTTELKSNAASTYAPSLEGKGSPSSSHTAMGPSDV